MLPASIIPPAQGHCPCLSLRPITPSLSASRCVSVDDSLASPWSGGSRGDGGTPQVATHFVVDGGCQHVPAPQIAGFRAILPGLTVYGPLLLGAWRAWGLIRPPRCHRPMGYPASRIADATGLHINIPILRGTTP